MTTNILTNTQYAVLEHAIDHTAGQIDWFPDGVKGGARHKVLQGLFAKAMIVRDGNDQWVVAAEGYDALGRERPAMASTPADPELDVALAAAEANWLPAQPDSEVDDVLADEPAGAPLATDATKKPRWREGSKQASVIAMLQRPEGATIAQIMAATQWQKHTIRGTFAGTFKKLGIQLCSDKVHGGERVYRMA